MTTLESYKKKLAIRVITITMLLESIFSLTKRIESYEKHMEDPWYVYKHGDTAREKIRLYKKWRRLLLKELDSVGSYDDYVQYEKTRPYNGDKKSLVSVQFVRDLGTITYLGNYEFVDDRAVHSETEVAEVI